MSLNTCEEDKAKAEDGIESTKMKQDFSVTMITATEDSDIVCASLDKEMAIEVTEKQTPSTVQSADTKETSVEFHQKMGTKDSISSHPQVDQGTCNQNFTKIVDGNCNAESDNLNNETEQMNNGRTSIMDIDRSNPVVQTELKLETSESCKTDHVMKSVTGVCEVTDGASRVSLTDEANQLSVKVVAGGTSKALESSEVSGLIGSSLVAYSSSEDENDSEDTSHSEESSSSSSTSDSEPDDENVADKEETRKRTNEADPSFVPRPLKTKTEVMLEDLPTVPYVDFRLADDEEISLLGKVSSIIGQLLVVGSNKDTPALNEETVLFGKNRHPIGVVFEIFGPVCNPFYTVRFNSVKDITNLELKLNDKVYFAPKHEEITKYVFVRELRKMKGSDASWTNDEEPPPECLDYSDDEKEREAKKKKTLSQEKRKDARQRDTNSQPSRPVKHFHNASDHHQQYRVTTSQHQQQSYSHRGPPSHGHPSFRGPRHHPSPWQQYGDHHNPRGNLTPSSSFQPPSNHQAADNSGPPPNLHNYQGVGHPHTVPPPISPYSMPPPFFAPLNISSFMSNPPPPPPPPPPGAAPRNSDFRQTQS